MKDFYETLGIDEKADTAAIKKAYRSLARKYHPDKNPDDTASEQRFKEVQEAYEILSDPAKRKKYDAMRKNPFGSGSFEDFFSTRGGSRFYRAPDGGYVRTDFGGGEADDPFGDGGLGDIFTRFFGGGRAEGQGPGARPQRTESTIKLSFDQSLKGGKVKVKLPHEETVNLSIPTGVRDGFRVRLKGRGQPGAGGRRGDLYVTFRVEESNRFRRVADDLYTTVTISAVEAMLGHTRNIENAYGETVKLAVPAGIQPGEKLRLKGQGVRTEEGTGDLYVEIKVSIPRDLPLDLRDALEKFRSSRGDR